MDLNDKLKVTKNTFLTCLHSNKLLRMQGVPKELCSSVLKVGAEHKCRKLMFLK